VHNVVPEEDKAQGKISLLTYLKYYKEGGGILLSGLLLLAYFITEVGVIFVEFRIVACCVSNSMIVLFK